MKFLLDTNICSAHLRRPGGLAHRFIQHTGQLAIPSLVLGELLAGAHRHPEPAQLLRGIDDLVLEVGVLAFDERCARRFGAVRAEQYKTGRPAGPVDAMIAAVALVHDLTLVTGNVKHFEMVAGLRIENWLDS